MNDDSQSRLLTKLKSELGKSVLTALADPTVIEIMLNPDGTLWVEKFGEPMKPIDSMTATNALAAMGTIAHALHTTIARDNPILEGELPLDGSRFEGLIPSVVAAPTFTVRKKASKVFTLSDYARQGILTAQVDGLDSGNATPPPPTGDYRSVLEWGVYYKKNILIVGGTGSGKTTFANAIIDAISTLTPDHRLVLIEDTAEIQCTAANKVILRATVDVSMQKLLRATLRLRPDRILVGEVRGAEALALLKAWNTGHPGGVATIHANGAMAGLVRLEQLVAESGMTTGVAGLIGEAVDMVVFIQKTNKVAAGRVVSEVLLVNGWTPANGYLVEHI